MELVFSARDHQYIIFWIFNREVPDKVSCRVEISQQLRKQRHAADAFLLLRYHSLGVTGKISFSSCILYCCGNFQLSHSFETYRLRYMTSRESVRGFILLVLFPVPCTTHFLIFSTPELASTWTHMEADGTHLPPLCSQLLGWLRHSVF
jgi:hypothetical protein